MSGLNVLVISHLYPRPDDASSGPFIRRQVFELSRRGVHITVLCPTPWVPPVVLPRRLGESVFAVARATPRSWSIDEHEVIAPRYLKLPGPLDHGLFGPLCALGVRGLARDLHRRTPFSVVHGQMTVPDGYAAVRIARELGIPSVTTERGYIQSLAKRGAGDRLALRWTLENATQTVFVARALAEFAKTLARPKREPRIVYTGLDLELYTEHDRTNARDRIGLPRDRRILLLVGADVKRKGLLVLLPALGSLVEAHPDLLLVVVGALELPSDAREQIERLRLADHVRVVGHKPAGELPLWYAACDIATLPSYREGLPNSVVEATASGRPVIASTVDGIPEIITDGINGLLVPPGEPMALAAAIRMILDDPAFGDRLASTARSMTRERFSWDRHAESMLEIYNSVVRSPS